MSCTQPLYALAPGWNNIDDLVVIEGLAPFGETPIQAFRGWATYDPGQFVIRGDGTLYISGYPTAQWIFGWLSRDQLYYFQTTYGNAGYSGKVTVATTSDIPDTLTIYNAVLIIDKLPNQNPYFNQYLDAVIRFTRMVPISEPMLYVDQLGMTFVDGEQMTFVSTG